MNGKQYFDTQITMVSLAKKAQELDFEAFIKCVENAEKAKTDFSDDNQRKLLTTHLESMKKLATTFQIIKKEYETTHALLSGLSAAYLANKK